MDHLTLIGIAAYMCVCDWAALLLELSSALLARSRGARYVAPVPFSDDFRCKLD